MLQEVENALETANRIQQQWANQLLRQRLSVVGKVAGQLASSFEPLLDALPRPNASRAEMIASEILPLADACRFAAKVGRQVLAPKALTLRNGAWWMGRIGVRQLAEPWGTVLILAPSNYPLLLPGVQIIQAVAAGNAVLAKPAPGCERVLERFVELLVAAGVPQDLVQILPSSIEYAQEAMRQGVDKVVLTGSVHTGRAVLRQLADTLTPSTMELSGCDAVLILPQADLKPVVDCLDYALRLNGGATCIAPRRVFVTPLHHSKLVEKLKAKITREEIPGVSVPRQSVSRLRHAAEQAIAAGAKLVSGRIPSDDTTREMRPIVLDNVTPDMEVARSDIFAPLISILQVDDMAAALDADRSCPYSLGISIFGPKAFAEHWADEVEAGCVVINDIVVPTADPRVAFGGRDQSGWGVTRGRAGLAEMTRPKAICSRHGNWRPHLDPVHGDNAELLEQLLQIFHASGWSRRFTAAKKMFQIVRKK